MKRIIAMILAVILCVSPLTMLAKAVENNTMPLSVSATAGEGNTVIVTVKANQDFSFATLVANVDYDKTVFTRNGNGTFNSAFDMGYDMANDGFMMSAKNVDVEPYMDNVASGTTIATYEFTYADDASAGEHSFLLSITSFEDGDFNSLMPSVPTASATYTIGSSSGEDENIPTDSGYEIYYTLSDSSRADSGDDLFTDYNIGDTVTATVKLKNNSSVDTYLQAYDLYLTYDSNLTYTGTTIVGAEYKDGNKLIHIQAVGEDSDGVVLEAVQFDAGAEVTLGTITFTINTAAVYNTPMPITLTVGKNSKTVTNIGVGGEGAGTGDSTSYYPVNTGMVDGAEVMTTYTVTYDANGGVFAEGAGTTQVKQHNVPLTIAAPAVPSREGYSFQGWSTEGGEDNNVNAPASYTTNADETLYAVWKQNTFTITFVDADGTTVLKTETVAYNEKPTPPASPSKEQDAQFSYQFDNWTPEIVEATTDATYTATYIATPRTYTITLNPNEGIYADESNVPKEYTFGTPVTLPSVDDISKDGYTFGGWYENSDFSGDPVTAIDENATGNKIYYAKWNANTYTITFKDGENVLATKEYNPDLAKDIQSLYTATKPGYTFSKWQVSVSGGNWPAAGEDIAASATVTGKYGDVTLSAVWTLDAYTITYNLDGGTVAVENKTTYGVNDEPFKLNNPTKTGYTFLGWTGSNGDTPQLEVTVTPGTALSNLTYTANWQINSHTITFKNGEEVVKEESLEYGATVTAPEDPSKTGYTFKGWAPAVPTTMPDNDLVIDATWEANTYGITLNPNGGEYVNGYEEPDKYTYDETQPLPDNDDIKKPGYTLEGWYEEETPDNVVQVIEPGTIGNKTYIAKWQANTYTITFNNENGGEIEKVTFTYGDTSITEPAVPVKNGYSGSWSTYDLTRPENQMVVPNYTVITYTITYNPNNGEETWTDSYTIETGVTIASAPVNGMYQFKGWMTSNAQGAWANDSIVNADSNHTDKYGNVTMTAQWEIPFTYAIEDYKYAYTDYVMLRIATDSAENCYSFGGENMFYTDDSNYKLEVEVDGVKAMKNVFVTLIPKMDGETKLVDGTTLTAAGMAKLAETTATAVTIARDGDVNGDGVLNIADANIVYQMVEQQSRGGYYSMEKLDIQARLEADMDTTVASNTDDHRGSIDDVDVIVSKINGVTG